MVLGAGRGTRLGELGRRVPKILVDVAGRPLLERQLDYLSANGVRRAVVNVHHLAEMVESFAEQYSGDVELVVIREENLLGTAGGVINALDELGPEPFFVLYGDVVVDEPLMPILHAHTDCGADATATVYESHEVAGKGTVVVDDDLMIRRFLEKDPSVVGPAFINAGLYVVEPRLLHGLPKGTEIDFGHDVFPRALGDGRPIRSFRLARPVIDVGTPEGLEAARALVSSAAGDAGA